MKANILWIEGRQVEGLPYIGALRGQGCTVEIVMTGTDALRRMPTFKPDLVVVNAASMRTSGTRICSAIRKQSSRLPIVVVTAPSLSSPKDECADVVLIQPFTPRKLLNWISPLLPWDDTVSLKQGPIRLDLDRRRVSCNGKVTRLTPSLTQLLKLLLDHHGEVLEREALFREVWNTDYIADTRTLDVHISWLRQAIEEDPRHPAYLKTIRGVGYRLDV